MNYEKSIMRWEVATLMQLIIAGILLLVILIIGSYIMWVTIHPLAGLLLPVSAVLSFVYPFIYR